MHGVGSVLAEASALVGEREQGREAHVDAEGRGDARVLAQRQQRPPARPPLRIIRQSTKRTTARNARHR